jgi:WD40 repeat protein
MIKYLYFIFFIISVNSYSQLDLAIQKGHSAEIVLLEFSKSNKYLASIGLNNEVIIWDVSLEKSVTSFILGEIEIIQGVKFTDDEKQLKVKTFRTTYFYDILNTKLTEDQIFLDTNYRQKDYFFDEESNYEVEIVKGALRKRLVNKKIRRYKKSVNHINAPFVAFDVSKKNNQLIGIAENELMFVYNYSLGVKYWELRGHNSEINDIRFSEDGKYFATAGKDRSIIIWDSKRLKIEKRLYSNIYKKKTATFSHDGKCIYVGDELGHIFEINLSGAFPSINVQQDNYHAVNQIIARKSGGVGDYFIVSENNYVYQKANVFDEKAMYKYVYKNNNISDLKERVLQSTFHTYQEPFGRTKLFDISEDQKRIVYTGESEQPNVSVAIIGSKKVRHLFIPYDNRQWTDVGFVSNNEVIATHDSSNVIYQWRLEEKDYYLKTDTLPFIINNFEYLGDNKIWLNSKFYGQFVYNLKSRKLTEKLKQSVEDIFLIDNYVVLATSSNSIIFYDLKKDKQYFSFMGHKALVTDVNIHPNKDLIISSSDDGSIKLWSLQQKKLLVTIFPFKNNEFIFINTDNYYLITKGAMDEIGFKYNGQFFFPEQFDLKFNRPDIILSQLGYNDEFLIDAYHRAYLKRLRKMNFTEEQLTTDFDLPEVIISNTNEIPKETKENKVQLKLKLTDKKHNIDRVNVWLNDVAIFGVNGINVRANKSKNIEKILDIDLAAGHNKIQISVLNESGAESYKKVIEVTSIASAPKPNLFLVSIGVSKHQNQNYNLKYADKDARDIAEAFKKNSFFNKVETMTLVNEQVTLKGLKQIKPFLNQASINDVVVVFVAGHGVLDSDFDYYFASHDMDFDNPSINGIPYEVIEKLLDGIKALKKLLLLDTCHSGEIDKEEVIEMEVDETESNVVFRAAGVSIQFKDNPLNLKSTNELMKSLFTDLRKGTGATVISSSGGEELSIEGGEYENGLFTYCLLKGLLNKEADLNKDKIITVSEIQKYVSIEVKILSDGIQTPTSRIENNILDYRVW